MHHMLELSPHQTAKLGQRRHGRYLQKPGCEIGIIMHNCSSTEKIEENETTNHMLDNQHSNFYEVALNDFKWLGTRLKLMSKSRLQV